MTNLLNSASASVADIAVVEGRSLSLSTARAMAARSAMTAAVPGITNANSRLCHLTVAASSASSTILPILVKMFMAGNQRARPSAVSVPFWSVNAAHARVPTATRTATPSEPRTSRRNNVVAMAAPVPVISDRSGKPAARGETRHDEHPLPQVAGQYMHSRLHRPPPHL